MQQRSKAVKSKTAHAAGKQSREAKQGSKAGKQSREAKHLRQNQLMQQDIKPQLQGLTSMMA